MGCGPSQLEVEAKRKKEAAIKAKPTSVLGKLTGGRQQHREEGEGGSCSSPASSSCIMSPTHSSKGSILSPRQHGFAAPHHRDSLSSSQQTTTSGGAAGGGGGNTGRENAAGSEFVFFVKSPPPPTGLDSPQPGKGNPLATSDTEMMDTSFNIED